MEIMQQVPPALLQQRFGPCLSLFVHLSHGERRADEMRVKALAVEAERLLLRWNPPLGEDQAYSLMRPLWRLLGSDSFWQDRRRNRAIFLAPGFFTELFLNHEVENAVSVGTDFVIRPLLSAPIASSFSVLTLHRDRVQLFAGDSAGIRPSRLKLPTFAQACSGGFNAKHGINVPDTVIASDHSRQRGSGDIEHSRTKAYYHLVAAILDAEYPAAHEPFVMVGTARNVALFRSVASTLADFRGQTLVVDPDSLTRTELQARVSEAVRPCLASECDESLQRLRENERFVERELASIIESAHRGQVETLWISRGATAWGTLRSERAPELHAIATQSDEDLLNFAAIEVLRHRGHVYEVDHDRLEPGAKAIAALRYLADRYEVDVPRERALSSSSGKQS